MLDEYPRDKCKIHRDGDGREQYSPKQRMEMEIGNI
jgi:hypothetical protein